MAGTILQALERCCSIQHNEYTEQTEHEEAKDEHHDGSVARQAGVNVGEPTILADFTTGANGFHLDDVLAHATWAMADFFHGQNPITPRIIVLFISIG